jgi:DNA polymerase III alpha subunit
MLRVRTGYSFRTAVGTLPEVLARLQECGYRNAPITDRASTFGWVRWYKLASELGLKPVFGVELAVVKSETLRDRKASSDYWTFLAINDISHLNKLFYLATQQFYYEPQLDYEQAINAAGVFKIVGYRSDLNLIPPRDDLFIGLAPSCSRGYINEARMLGHQLVAASDNKFTNPTRADKLLYETICGREAAMQTYDQFIQTEDQWRQSVSRQASEAVQEIALLNSAILLTECNAKLKQSALLTPPKSLSLFEMCVEGAARLGINLDEPVYQARLTMELNLIEEKEFEDYFFIIADMCQWARAHMLVGPARGSSAGSLVCYLLGITTIDPIPYGLIFERFIDVNRNDLPDIDIDFSDQHREEVFEYMRQKYGHDRVARIGSVALYKAPSALNEAGMALRVPKWKCDAVLESLLKRSSGDARAVDMLKDTIQLMSAGKDLIRDHPEMLIATRMEGHPRHSSQHAAGIVLTKEPAVNYLAVDARTETLHCDKKDAEALNLLKIDALGLTQLSTFEYALQLAGLDRLALEHIPLDDSKALNLLNDAKFCGIFQFNGLALQSIVKQFKVTQLEDIVAITALARPGPLASGNAHEWVRRKNGVHGVSFPHPLFEPYLRGTLGIVLYQEQVMEIGRHIGDLSWGDVSELRRAMSKSMGADFFNQFGDKWKANAIAKGIGQAVATKMWDDLCSYGSWSFNRSHAVAYGLISYYCLWLKAHHPFEFAAATLTNEHDPDKQIELLREMVAEGYDYVAVDAERSTDKWTVGRRQGKQLLIGPFSNIKGIGPKTIEQVLQARERGLGVPTNVLRLINEAEHKLGSLFPIKDAFERVLHDPNERRTFGQQTRIKDIDIRPKDYRVNIYCVLAKINPRDENELVNIARRGGKVITGEPTASLNLQLRDDSDTMFGKISRWDYDQLGKAIVDRGRVGKCLYVISGKIKGGTDMAFRMIKIDSVHYLGELAVAKAVAETAAETAPEQEQLLIF